MSRGIDARAREAETGTVNIGEFAMKLSHLFTAAALGLTAVTLASCGPTDYSSVTVLAEPTPVNGRTFAWQQVATAPGPQSNPEIDNPIFKQRVETAVNAAMAAKGYQLVNAGSSPDLLLAYRVGTQQKSQLDVQQYPGYVGGPMMCGRFGCGGGWGWGYYGAPQTSVTQVNYTEGGLMLDIMDGKTGTLEWRALYKDRVTAATAEQASLNAIAVKTLASLPNAGGVAAAAPKK
jgi:hypothetical protein